jgi:hypothetical protein
MKPPHGRKEIEAMFGNPAGSNGHVNPHWEDQNIRKIAPPDGWLLYYQDSGKLTPVTGIRMHVLLADSFHAVLSDVWAYAKKQIGGNPSTAKIQAWIHNLRLDQHCGGYNYRPITGGSKLSLHSYGIAIDWDADHNPRKKPLTKKLPDWWYDIWNAHGWSDGRTYATPDPMHVQFATGA